jgi:hypothetical protein
MYSTNFLNTISRKQNFFPAVGQLCVNIAELMGPEYNTFDVEIYYGLTPINSIIFVTRKHCPVEGVYYCNNLQKM